MTDIHEANNYRHRWHMDAEELTLSDRPAFSILIKCLDCDLTYRDHEIVEIVSQYHHIMLGNCYH